MQDHRYFELLRQCDDLVYQFDSQIGEDGSHSYKRRDGDYWIVKKSTFGWIAVDPISGEIAGRPWSVLPKDQLDYPPEGDWVSKKGAKSYVYTLYYPSHG